MELKVYGISAEDANDLGYTIEEIESMSHKERHEKVIDTAPANMEVLAVKEFFYLLNNEKIDTENNYYFIA